MGRPHPNTINAIIKEVRNQEEEVDRKEKNEPGIDENPLVPREEWLRWRAIHIIDYIGRIGSNILNKDPYDPVQLSDLAKELDWLLTQMREG